MKKRLSFNKNKTKNKLLKKIHSIASILKISKFNFYIYTHTHTCIYIYLLFVVGKVKNTMVSMPNQARILTSFSSWPAALFDQQPILFDLSRQTSPSMLVILPDSCQDGEFLPPTFHFQVSKSICNYVIYSPESQSLLIYLKLQSSPSTSLLCTYSTLGSWV